MSAPDLTGLVVVVTGATGSAGPAVVDRLSAAGATVVAAGRDQERLQRVADAASGPGRVVTSTVDLSDDAATQAWGRELVREHGRIDGLLHLVGGWRGGKGIVDTDLADWNALHESLIRTLQHATRALHDSIKASPRGRMAIISTTQMPRPSATNAAYASAKAAAETWTFAVADSWKGTQAAAAVVPVKALLTPAMRKAKPEAKFTGFIPVAELADKLVGLWERPADEVNGSRL